MADKEDELKEIEKVQRKLWQSLQEIKFDELTPEQRKEFAHQLYSVMNYRPTPEDIEIPFDFWTEYGNTDEVKDVKRYNDYVIETFNTLPLKPTREVWLNRERGIIPTMKREWKDKVEPFRNERLLKKKMEEKISEMLNDGKKDFSIDYDTTLKKMQENIEETLYQPTRKQIEAIEAEIKKRTS